MTYQGCVLIRTTVFVAGTVSACALVLFQLSPEALLHVAGAAASAVREENHNPLRLLAILRLWKRSSNRHGPALFPLDSTVPPDHGSASCFHGETSGQGGVGGGGGVSCVCN